MRSLVFKLLKRHVVFRKIHGVERYVEVRWLGSKYGAWPIPFGVVGTNPLVLSFGIGTDISFDLAMIERFGARVFAFDPTPRSIEWLRQQKLPDGFTYFSFGVGSSDGTARFLLPDREDFVSFKKAGSTLAGIELPVRRVKTIMEELNIPAADIIKMDIEGFEYEVLEDMIECQIMPSVLLVEFHHSWFGKSRYLTKSTVEVLRRCGYKIFAISETGKEYGFLLERK